MDLYAVIDHVVTLLQKHGRVSYRSIQLQFALTDEQLAVVTDELIAVRELAVDKDGKMLVWQGDAAAGSAPSAARRSSSPAAPAQVLPPVAYTPPHLAERIRTEQATLEARGIPDGERKTITALFADLAGFTALARDLDPEETRQIIDPALQLMMAAVHRYEGYVAQSLGDGIFALFGAPIAHEDHPQRALYAALRMQEDMRRYADTVRVKKGVPLQIRVGINTGEVVVRSIRKDDLHTDYVPVGHSTNLAARLEGLANPGSIVVSEATHQLTEGYFEFQSLGAVAVKGLDAPLPIYEVVGVGPLRTKLQVAARRGLARFVGRQSVLAQLRQALEQSKAGHGQMVGVMGEPGVGKSRLFYEFKRRAQTDCLVLETFSVSHGKAYAYMPLMDLLKTYFQFTIQDDERTRQEKLTGKVLTLDRSLEETLPYLSSLLGIAEPTSPLQQMDSQIRRRRTLEAIKRLMVRESLNQPLLLIFEDLHWLDGETQAFLNLLSESMATARMLLLVNYRPEYRHEWGSKTFYTQLRLDPLGQAEAQELLTALLGDGAGLQGVKRRILEQTEGNPFFMEEVVQTLAEEKVLGGERGNYRLEKVPTALHLPATVQGVLAARIDRLPPAEKHLLQTLAVIGKEFAWSLLRQIVEQPEEELYRLLSYLQGAEFVYEQPAFPEVEYVFKHALTQEVAYHSLLLERRRVLHERTAKAIEEVYRDGLEDHYSELAQHYGRSGNTQKAVEYFQRAGQQAVQRSAHTEAISDFTTALELLKTLPDTVERAQHELPLQIALGGALMAAKGWAAPEVEHAYARAQELCQQVGETPQLFPALWGLCLFHSGRGELQTAQGLGERLLSLAQRAQDSALLLEAHHPLWALSLWHGELTAAREHCEQGIALYESPQHHSLTFLYGGHDPGVCCRKFVALALWLLGYPDQALRRSQEGLTLARELAHPSSQAFALDFAAILHQYCREGQAAQERAEAAISLSTDQGFPFGLAFGTMVRGWALAEQGYGEGLVQMRQGLAAYRTTGAEEAQSYFLALLAETCGKVGQAEEGLKVLLEALAYVDKTGEQYYEAELYRLKGELLLVQEGSRLQAVGCRENTAEAEECFLKAIEIAREQQAKSLELRAAVSLSRLWQVQDKRKEAHGLLAGIYDWFTEGFDTKDLQEARALLDELATAST